MKISTILVWLGIGLTSAASQADTRLPFKPSQAEIQVLPEYCIARLSNNKDLQTPWIQKMGKENYLHLHHYCYGLNFVNRARIAFNSRHKRHYLQTALANFNYVIRNWPENFALTAEAKAHKAQLEAQIAMEVVKRY